ncbi:hypothetical protein [Halonotius sp. GCM10025705]|uniref:hypothetical protein n=1 Tax=Halonotius sp. GCM10025705 TaxID=3252678 RepID=UPI0036210DFF
MAVAASPTAAGSPLLVAAVIDQPILVVIYGITLAISVWLFRDARRRQRSIPVAAGWAVGGFVLPGIVHFGYLYGRLNDTSSRPEESPEDDA